MIYTGVGTAGRTGKGRCYLPDVVGSSTRGILDAIANGLLVAGDNLVLDNAKIHYAAAIKPLLHALLPALVGVFECQRIYAGSSRK
eukprot:g16809.t1